VRHAGGVLSPAELRRTRIAELRAAVIRAHPDHGGTTKSLQAALTALRSELNRTEPKQRVPEPPPPPATPWRTREAPTPPRRTVRGAAVGILKTLFWVYCVALPITLGLALLVAKAAAWLV
jgi:LmbE family N-acetylglucosaminyl deacetylase